MEKQRNDDNNNNDDNKDQSNQFKVVEKGNKGRHPTFCLFCQEFDGPLLVGHHYLSRMGIRQGACPICAVKLGAMGSKIALWKEKHREALLCPNQPYDPKKLEFIKAVPSKNIKSYFAGIKKPTKS